MNLNTVYDEKDCFGCMRSMLADGMQKFTEGEQRGGKGVSTGKVSGYMV